MKPEEIIIDQILNPKKDKLVNHLIKIVSGEENSFQRCEPWLKYYEIWYYCAFDFKYIFLATNNLVVNIVEEEDVNIFNLITMINDQPVTGLQQVYDKYRLLELEFISDCWKEMENTLDISERCFWVEHGSLRVYDVNNRTEINEDRQSILLEKEGLQD